MALLTRKKKKGCKLSKPTLALEGTGRNMHVHNTNANAFEMPFNN